MSDHGMQSNRAQFIRAAWRGREIDEPIQALRDPTYPPDKSLGQNQQNGDSGLKDLWQVAYESEKLSDKDRQNLSPTQATTESCCVDGHGHRVKTVQLIDKVVRLTEKQYENYCKGGWNISQGAGKEDIKLRDVGQRILDATLSFKDIISKVAVFDPTGHASSAWGIVSLGLTMTQNHIKIRNALFKSSEFLTDVLARCAFIEKEHYHKNQFETKNELEKAIIQVYVGILQYTAQVHAMQKAGAGLKTLESVSEVTDHPIIQIQSYIENDERKLHHWVDRDQHLKQSKQAENILAGIDKIFFSIQNLHQKLDLHNLQNSEGASFDSYMDQHESECLSGTRTALLKQIEEWGCSSQSQCIFWLNGMAGTGKSTISRTVAKSFQEKGLLGASFFFKRGEGDRGNAGRFFSTITRQLITTIPQLAPDVSKAIVADPDISTKSLRDQFHKLLLQPLHNLDLDDQTTPVIVIDALDECDGDKDIQLLLQLFPQVQKSNSVQLRVFVTSRPELPIQLGFQDAEVRGNHRDLVLHEIPNPVIKDDISLFLKHKLKKIKEQRSLPENWLEDSDVQTLVTMSVPLFIFAATVCRVFEDYDLDPVKSLAEILEYQSEESKLDGTYLPVLNRLSANHGEKRKRELVKEFQDVVGTIIILESPLSIISLSKLLGIPKGLINTRLNRLHSVLQIPDHETMPVRLFHLSFREFLLDTNTREKTPFWIDEKEMHQKIAVQCLTVMFRCLKKNMCNLESEGMQRTEIDRDSINRFIPPELQYSCRYWTQHLAQGKDPISKMDNAFLFLQEHFLHWAEVMCILGYASEIVQGIERLQSLIHNNASSELSEFLHDTRRFMMKYRHIADSAPLQLYCSGLIFAPSKSIVRETFGTEMPKWICRLPTVEEFWNAELETLEGHNGWVNSVTFSQDGRWLASGSYDDTIKLWDPVRTEVSILNKDWVALQGKKALWLPPAYRPSCVETGDGKLAMGHLSGRISFFQFCL
ncbi:NACHT and WD repeat domain-containing protein [Aspergillus glaucus CBS 516.65]|uniref:Nephrocystin 3-like N-terminal domain-containing protein n=1 Tax=Aspergillus glaucus CBS 516.65 TaxID=1160497 RepID=A0A1L9VBD3_ASPGL|nr:hypothetical protein ASPGLDRAFT_68939 [Aspergillus glaucus CBS 516.65]OJJ81248.1 hypothetical protein ASPGLDRAFT_68939 [Aspergillus glaucus CBS 516.65]